VPGSQAIPAFRLPLHTDLGLWLKPSRLLRQATKRRRSVASSDRIVDLQAAINRFLVKTNDKSAPLRLDRDPEEIIAAPSGAGHQMLDSIHSYLGQRFAVESFLLALMEGVRAN